MIENVNVSFRVSRQNLYHVPLKQWRKWSPQARQVFNEVYSSMQKKDLFLHPKAPVPSREQWKTTAWNAAWIAAGAAQEVVTPLEEAYANMRDWAEKNGVDTAARG